ncbi:MAG TPA: TrmH family RNA methyltransferase [Candidatus Saccharimonadia bacterium]|nr:TrmH family RNA methyltransferase [Candidatus Saccharimonadia bacterium]
MPRDDAPRSAPPHSPRREQRDRELRIFGVNACLGAFAHRPESIRKAYLVEALVPRFRDALAVLARRRIGYRIVAADDLEKLTQSQHHEGVCFEVLRPPPLALHEFLKRDRARGEASLLVWLDGVGNPHNFGAVLRIAAHFGAEAVLLPPGSGLAMTGAAARVAEGAAEIVPVVATGELHGALDTLRRARYEIAATVVRGGRDLYLEALPKRLVLVFGAENTGLSPALSHAVPLKLEIPGTGLVESLNIASAVAVVAAEHWRRHRGARER